jgi:hypothetical protein
MRPWGAHWSSRLSRLGWVRKFSSRIAVTTIITTSTTTIP